MTSTTGSNKAAYLSADAFEYPSDAKGQEQSWSKLYAIIKAANLIVDNAGKVPTTQDEINIALGQVYYWRAFSYFSLVRLFGPRKDYVYAKQLLLNDGVTLVDWWATTDGEPYNGENAVVGDYRPMFVSMTVNKNASGAPVAAPYDYAQPFWAGVQTEVLVPAGTLTHSRNAEGVAFTYTLKEDVVLKENMSVAPTWEGENSIYQIYAL